MRKTYGPGYPRTLGALMAWSGLDPEAPAVTDAGGTLDRRAFQNRVLHLTAGLRRGGVGSGGCRTGAATWPQSLPALGLVRLPSISIHAFGRRKWALMLIRQHQVTHVVGGDDMFGRIAAASRGRRFDSVRFSGFAAFHSSAAASIALAEVAGMHPHGLYGSSEMQRMNKMPNMTQAGIYSATTHYLKAVEAAGTDATQPVMEKMRSTPINDFFVGNGKIREDGRMVHEMYLYEVKKPAESKGAWDYYKLVATIPADQAFQPLSESKCPLVKKAQ